MALLNPGSPRLNQHCFDRQTSLFAICLESPHGFIWQRQPPSLSTLFLQVTPVVSNLPRKPPWLRQLPSLSPLFPTCLGSPRCFKFGQEAPVASFSKGSPHVVNMVLIGSPHETSRKPPQLLFVDLCIRQPPYDPMYIIITGSPQVAPII